jgi:hypothetical protein
MSYELVDRHTGEVVATVETFSVARECQYAFLEVENMSVEIIEIPDERSFFDLTYTE